MQLLVWFSCFCLPTRDTYRPTRDCYWPTRVKPLYWPSKVPKTGILYDPIYPIQNHTNLLENTFGPKEAIIWPYWPHGGPTQILLKGPIYPQETPCWTRRKSYWTGIDRKHWLNHGPYWPARDPIDHQVARIDPLESPLTHQSPVQTHFSIDWVIKNCLK